MFVWRCFSQPKQRLSFPRALRSFHTVKADIDLFFFFFFLIYIVCLFRFPVCSLTEVTATQRGVRRVVLQGTPEGVIWLTGSWMRSRSLQPAHLFAHGPSRRTAAAAPDKAQVCGKFSTSATVRRFLYGFTLNLHSFIPQTKWSWIPTGWRTVAWPVTPLLLRPLHPGDLPLPAAAAAVVPPLVRTPRARLHRRSPPPAPPPVLNRPVAAPRRLLQTLFQQGKSQDITSQPKRWSQSSSPGRMRFSLEAELESTDRGIELLSLFCWFSAWKSHQHFTLIPIYPFRNAKYVESYP